jgi:hypothetical protein
VGFDQPEGRKGLGKPHKTAFGIAKVRKRKEFRLGWILGLFVT